MNTPMIAMLVICAIGVPVGLAVVVCGIFGKNPYRMTRIPPPPPGLFEE